MWTYEKRPFSSHYSPSTAYETQSLLPQNLYSFLVTAAQAVATEASVPHNLYYLANTQAAKSTRRSAVRSAASSCWSSHWEPPAGRTLRARFLTMDGGVTAGVNRISLVLYMSSVSVANLDSGRRGVKSEDLA